MPEVLSHSPAETEALGFAWGQSLARGWVIGLSGDLGAGKTHLVKGIARGVGITRPVQSPTFALLHEYHDGRLPLFHLDLYRLETRAAIIGAGLEEYLDRPAGVSLVEWVERWLPEDAPAAGLRQWRRVRIEQTGEQSRKITYEDFGA